MSSRRELKKKIAKLKQFKTLLPIYIDYSEIYGDGTYSHKDYEEVDKKIEELENKLKKL